MSPAHRFTLSDNTSMTPDADAAVSVALARQLHEIAAFCLARLLQVSLSRLHPLLAHRHSFLASFKMPCANARYIRPRPAFSFAALIAISFPNFPHTTFLFFEWGIIVFFVLLRLCNLLRKGFSAQRVLYPLVSLFFWSRISCSLLCSVVVCSQSRRGFRPVL